jgi:hypothetical protein
MFARTIWILLAVVVLSVSLANFDRESNPDISIFLFYGMVVLSFPTGLILAAILSIATIGLHSVFGVEIASNFGSIVVMWLAFLAVGYWQWFVLVPYLRLRLKNRNRTTKG